MNPVVRVGTAEAPDGALLHWRADGQGPIALLASNGIGISTFFWRRLAAHFAPTHTFITWDYRGHGSSPVPDSPENLTVALCARDLWTVVDRVGFQRAVLLGHSMGSQVIFEAYRQHRGRVQALLPMLGAAGKVWPIAEAGAPKRDAKRRVRKQIDGNAAQLAELRGRDESIERA